MARAKSPEKRQAILQAAVHEMAQAGLAASTARIAKTANLAEGTLFTYFASKNDLLNEVYVEIKNEVYRRLHNSFPHGAELRERVKHVWTETLHLAIEKPEERKVSLQLHLSSCLTDTTRELVGSRSGVVAQTMTELAGKGSFRDLPSGFAASAMAAMQDAVMESIARTPQLRDGLVEKGFAAFWRMVE